MVSRAVAEVSLSCLGLEKGNSVKAAGIAIQFVYHNFRIVYYIELDDITYANLGTLKYSQVGE